MQMKIIVYTLRITMLHSINCRHFFKHLNVMISTCLTENKTFIRYTSNSIQEQRLLQRITCKRHLVQLKNSTLVFSLYPYLRSGPVNGGKMSHGFRTSPVLDLNIMKVQSGPKSTHTAVSFSSFACQQYLKSPEKLSLKQGQKKDL